MVAYHHPSELNPYKLYRQASNLLKGTSRATNDGWYESPLNLDFQVHLRTDGSRFDSWIFHRPNAAWTPGPAFTEELLSDPTKVPAFAAELLSLAKAAGFKSLGVVLHLADEFATAELKPELDNPGALAELRQTIVGEPTAVLDDSSVSTEDTSWRLIPYPAADGEAIATSIALSRHASAFVDELRAFAIAKNFPIATLAASAPLVALLALPDLHVGPLERSFLVVLPYARFTVLAFFNPRGDLQLLRTLQHRGQPRPTNLRHAATTTAAALEMATPDVFILPLAGGANSQMVSDLQVVFEGSSIRECDWSKTRFHKADLAAIPPELLISTSLDATPETPLAAAHTFATLKDEGWALQDFLPVPPAAAQIFPNRAEMKMLRIAQRARLGIGAVAALALLWMAFSIVTVIRQPEWTFKAEEAQSVTSNLNLLGAEKKKVEHWENLLEDRSKGWTSMEMLARLFPDKQGFLVKSYSHKTSPEVVPGQPKVGLVKEWRIAGLAREEALARLTDLNTRDGVSAAFSEIARVTGNQSFRSDVPSRTLLVNIRTIENSGYKGGAPDESYVADESTYPFQFDLTITQRFESTDPMAMTTSKAP